MWMHVNNRYTLCYLKSKTDLIKNLNKIFQLITIIQVAAKYKLKFTCVYVFFKNVFL